MPDQLQVEIEPLQIFAEVAGRTDVVLGVQVEPECALAIVHQTTAP